MIKMVYTGHEDSTVRIVGKERISFESETRDTFKDVFRVAKKEKTDEGHKITTTDGEEWEFFEGEYDEDDMSLIRKGSIAGYWSSMDEAKLSVGYTSDFIKKTIEKYFIGAN